MDTRSLSAIQRDYDRACKMVELLDRAANLAIERRERFAKELADAWEDIELDSGVHSPAGVRIYDFTKEQQS